MRADDQALVCMYKYICNIVTCHNLRQSVQHIVCCYYVCRHNTTIFSSCSPKTISVNVTKSFWIPSDILLFSFLLPLSSSYAMLWHVHVISVSWHAHVTFWELSKSDETPWRRRENVKAQCTCTSIFGIYFYQFEYSEAWELGRNVFYIIEHFTGNPIGQPYRVSTARILG